MSRESLWHTIYHRPTLERGFDYHGGGVSHFSISEPPPGFGEPRDPDAILIEDEVRGTLMAIAETAGFPALLAALNPDVTDQAARALWIAREIEDAARTLRLALETHITEPRAREEPTP